MLNYWLFLTRYLFVFPAQERVEKKFDVEFCYKWVEHVSESVKLVSHRNPACSILISVPNIPVGFPHQIDTEVLFFLL